MLLLGKFIKLHPKAFSAGKKHTKQILSLIRFTLIVFIQTSIFGLVHSNFEVSRTKKYVLCITTVFKELCVYAIVFLALILSIVS